jgi:sortase A
MQLGRILHMGERSRLLRGKRRVRLYALVVASCLAFFGVLLLGISVLGASDGLLGRVTDPTTTSERDPSSEFATEELERAAEQEAAYMASALQARTAEEPAKEEAKKEPAEQFSDEGTPQAAVPSDTTMRSAPSDTTAYSVPSDTTMHLTIPAMGLYDIPVLEGTSEGILSQGVGHLPGTGFPWVAGSNTYIAGHRIGYPGTVSDHIFWDLPNLAVGDQVVLEDSLGQTYTYQVSEILEVSPGDLSVTGSTGTGPQGPTWSRCRRASRTTATTGRQGPTGWPAT